MLSRVADSIYWMNRYLERIDNIARFIEAHLNLTLEVPAEFSDQWLPLIEASDDVPLFNTHYPKANRESVIAFLTLDRNNPNSVISSLEQARENARTVREWVSNSLWEEINQFYWKIKETHANETENLENLFIFLDSIKRYCYVLAGILSEALSDSDASYFGTMGRFIERADKVTRILDTKSYFLVPKGRSTASAFDLIQWGSILRSMGAQDMYRREYGILDPQKIAEFLLLSASFPRSLRFCVAQVQKALHAVTGQNRSSFKLTVEKHLGRLKANLDFIEIQEVFAFGLHPYLDNMQKRLNLVDTHIYQQFFSLITPSEQDGKV